MKNWKHTKTILDGEYYEISGVNIWNHTWINTGNQIKIKDPIYNQDYTFTIYKTSDGQTTIEFAAGEFSNNVWGIYERNTD
ncbi:MAG: hypothetical protein K0R51_3473 [Cytophagaceae bacterium]|jgi:hypothetical protein|nr:hypothetical protein [Cytophagaceae bacterium]